MPRPAGDGAGERSYEETNGPVPRVDIFDENGLAQQTSGPPGDPRGPPNQTAGAAAIHDFDLTNETLSNISPDMMGAMPGFVEAAAQGAAHRYVNMTAAERAPARKHTLCTPLPQHAPRRLANRTPQALFDTQATAARSLLSLGSLAARRQAKTASAPSNSGPLCGSFAHRA